MGAWKSREGNCVKSIEPGSAIHWTLSPREGDKKICKLEEKLMGWLFLPPVPYEHTMSSVLNLAYNKAVILYWLLSQHFDVSYFVQANGTSSW